MSIISDTKSKTARSLKSLNIQGEGSRSVIPVIDQMIEAACAMYHCPQKIIVWRETPPKNLTPRVKSSESKSKKFFQLSTKTVGSKSPDRRTADASGRTQTASTHSPVTQKDNNIPQIVPPPKSDKSTVVLRCLYDANNRLLEALLLKVPQVPRILMQVLTIFAPMYKQLNKFTIKRSVIDGYIVHEIGKLLACSLLTEVCLDGSPTNSYTALLEARSHLKHLSLCQCNINDESCKQIASKLHHLTTSAAETLQILNLTSNYITDEGAKHLGLALRTNRALRYLNLSGNQLTDIGAGYIFDVLMPFPLTFQECVGRWRRHSQYIRERSNSLETNIEKFYKDESSIKMKKKRRQSLPKGVYIQSNAEELKLKAESTVTNFMEPFVDPFGVNEVKIIDGYTHCLGNTTLYYLNLAYNNLEFLSLKKLLSVLRYQNDDKPVPEGGLAKVILDGNYLPQNCLEIALITEYFARKCYKPDSRRSKASSVSRHRVRTPVASAN